MDSKVTAVVAAVTTASCTVGQAAAAVVAEKTDYLVTVAVATKLAVVGPITSQEHPGVGLLSQIGVQLAARYLPRLHLQYHQESDSDLLLECHSECQLCALEHSLLAHSLSSH